MDVVVGIVENRRVAGGLDTGQSMDITTAEDSKTTARKTERRKK